MTPADRKALLALHEATTPGPWVQNGDLLIQERSSEHIGICTAMGERDLADAAFIVAAHTQLPALCRELDEAEVEIERLMDASMKQAHLTNAALLQRDALAIEIEQLREH